MKNNPIILFGEVLFDHFPNGENVLGGAPFNVAWHLQAFGQQPQFISRLGKDQTGELIRQAMHDCGMSLDHVQQDSVYPTGQVQVMIEKGEPSYSILPDQAYDHMEILGIDGLNQSGILYHGTLVNRSPASRKALRSLKAAHQGKIFIDVNLRPPWWNKADVLGLINDADWVKLNLDEFHALQSNPADIKTSMEKFLTRYNLDGLVVTCGEEGALALNYVGDFITVAPNKSVSIVDTVGAGDAFSAVFLTGLNLGWPLELTMDRAQAFAAAMIGQRGATVKDLKFYDSFMATW
jgi:fructokinase